MENEIKMTLLDIENARKNSKSELSAIAHEYERQKEQIEHNLAVYDEWEKELNEGFDPDIISSAKEYLRIEGNIYAQTDSNECIVPELIEDCINGFPKLKKEYLYNKRYSGFYQTGWCEYGYCPTYGNIVDSVELTDYGRKHTFTDKQKNMCLYYIKYLGHDRNREDIQQA